MSFTLETIAFNIESCSITQNAGAHRIELCANPAEGGTTPSYGFIKAARKILHIQLYPIIRPRGGDFLYNDASFEVMKEEIKTCKQLGCDGVVIGMLNADATIDKKRCSILVNLAYPLGVTFHRAFDRVTDPQKALEDVIEIGCERILTSGFFPTAAEGADNIRRLIEQADDRIIIMPGSGIRANNIVQIAEMTGAAEFHSSASKKISSGMSVSNPMMKEHPEHIEADPAEIINMLNQLNSISR